MGRRENQDPARGVEPVERRVNQEKKEQRALQASVTKVPRESLAHLGQLVLPALQGLPQSFPLAVTAQFLPESQDPEDHLDSRAPRDHQELMESQVILVRMERLVLKDLQASQELQVILDPKEIREIVERVTLAQGDHQDLQDPQDLDTDLHLWTWRAQDFLIWNLSGDCLAHQVPLVPLALLVLLQQVHHPLLGHLDLQGETEHQVNRACQVCQVLMAPQDFLVLREKRVIQASSVYQE